MSSPKSATRGNQMSALAMLIAIVTALLEGQVLNPLWVAGGLAVGATIGLVLAVRVQMTSMPELVAILNGLGGGASALVALGASFEKLDGGLVGVEGLVVGLSMAIGTLTLTGSLVAYGKLSGKVPSRPIVMPMSKQLNILMVGVLLVGIAALMAGYSVAATCTIMVVAAAFGFLLVLPIGGADMPVVISLLNSYSGVAAAATGFVFQNYVLIVSGALVGASGLILTGIMCKAMNRSLGNVLFGAFGESGAAAGALAQRNVKGFTVDDVMMQLTSASSVVIVPGYGLAVAQAQHTIRELEELLMAANVDVKYAIHPVAGRMPGHMNVLLAEANIDYERQVELDSINPEFESTDVVMVVGANDVTNPAARDDKTSPIYGMPILDVDRARTCIVLKRSMSPGFAGIDNDLFYRDNTMMVFGDAKKTLIDIVNQAKAELH